MKLKYIMFMLLMLALPYIAGAQTAKDYIKQGNKMYEKQKYNEAEKNYKKALDKSKQSVTGRFNMGDAMYRQGKYKEAAEKFLDATAKDKDKKIKAGAYHNLGNSLLQAGEYEKSILAYKNALKLNPGDKDTKYNLEYARQKLIRQQQQNSSRKNQDNKDKQNRQNQENNTQDDQDKNKQDQNQSAKNNENNNKQGNQQQPGQDKKISKEDAERMLNALNNEEKQNLKDLQKKMRPKIDIKIEKKW